MNPKQLQVFEILILNSEYELDVAKVLFWKEAFQNITFENVFYTQLMLYYFEYSDIDGLNLNVSGSRVGDAFHNLYGQLQDRKIKMLIKGCSLKYYQVRHTYNTLYTHQLLLGKTVNYKSSKIHIFERENDIYQVVTKEKQLEYYNQWIASITES